MCENEGPQERVLTMGEYFPRFCARFRQLSLVWRANDVAINCQRTFRPLCPRAVLFTCCGASLRDWEG